MNVGIFHRWISLIKKICQRPPTGEGDFFDGKDLTHPRARVGFMTEEISHSPRAEIFPTEKILHRARGVGGFFLRKRFDTARPTRVRKILGAQKMLGAAGQHINQIPPPFCVCVLCLLTASPPPRQ